MIGQLSPVLRSCHLDVLSPTRSVGRRLWFDADAVVHCPANTRLAAQVPFGGLYRNVSQQELDLLQLASGAVTQFRAGPGGDHEARVARSRSSGRSLSPRAKPSVQ